MSGIGAPALSGRVSERRLRFGQRPTRPWRAIEAATVLTDTRQPGLDRVLLPPGRTVAAGVAAGVLEGRLHRRIQIGLASLTNSRHVKASGIPCTVLWDATNDATLIASTPRPTGPRIARGHHAPFAARHSPVRAPGAGPARQP